MNSSKDLHYDRIMSSRLDQQDKMQVFLLYLQLPLRYWGAPAIFTTSSWKVNIAENLIAIMRL